MQYYSLAHSDLKISRLGLGTMTFGEQNTESDAHAQLDMALEAGINFIDTAELYPVPPSPEKYGTTESYIGTWLAKKNQMREKVILATKVTGPARGDFDRFRSNQRLDAENISQALDASLKRLQTDYIDLYQIHWPQRRVNSFGQLNFPYDASEMIVEPDILETLEALNQQVKAGKIRYIGVSNETPWGVMQYLRLAERYHLPRIVSIQNPYNLLNRSFEVGLSEITQHERVALLAYSCLGFGTLSGKYLNGVKPVGARNTLYSRFTRYSNQQAEQAISEYVALAKKYALDPAQMALAYVYQQPFVASVLLGATTLDQLSANIESQKLILSDEILKNIEDIFTRYPNPAP